MPVATPHPPFLPAQGRASRGSIRTLGSFAAWQVMPGLQLVAAVLRASFACFDYCVYFDGVKDGFYSLKRGEKHQDPLRVRTFCDHCPDRGRRAAGK
jgi:hypothetical protein